MAGKKLFYIILSFTIGAILLILWSSTSQPGVKDLAGDFKEVALYRNENNTGPIIRIYAVTLTDTLWQEMKQYGDFMPHTKYGNTSVYFFLKDSPVPAQLQPGQQHFSADYEPYCLAVYEKNNMGQVSFIRKPFLKN